MKDNRDELMERLQKDVHWEYTNDYLDCDNEYDIIEDFEEWLKTARIGETYYWSIYSYTLEEDTEDEN